MNNLRLNPGRSAAAAALPAEARAAKALETLNDQIERAFEPRPGVTTLNEVRVTERAGGHFRDDYPDLSTRAGVRSVVDRLAGGKPVSVDYSERRGLRGSFHLIKTTTFDDLDAFLRWAQFNAVGY